MPIHALMFGWEYPPLHWGGLGVACQGLVRGLLHHNVKVTLVLPHPNAEEQGANIVFPTEALRQTVRVKSMVHPYDSLDSYADRVRAIPREMNRIYGEDLPQAITTYTALSVEMTKHTKPDVIHCHDWMTYAAGIRAARHHGVPMVAHIHATELDRTHFHPNQWIYDQERRGLHAADCIIAVSNYTKEILVRHYGIPSEKIVVVHNSSAAPARVGLTSSTKDTAHPMVLFLGRLTIQKGPWQFLEMAAKVHALRPDVQFVIAGDGHMLGELIHRSMDLGLHDCVAFAGKVSGREADALYRRADCFVMPSLSEPFGLVALEAIAHGTPVILSKQSGVSEVVGHALKVDFWDTEKMADCVLTVLREQPLAEQLRSEAPRVLSHLTWRKQAGIVKSLYENLIQS